MRFIAKPSDIDALSHALRVVIAGGVYLPPVFGQTSPSPPPAAKSVIATMREGLFGWELTQRQIRVRELIIQNLLNKHINLLNKHIGRRLDLSEATIKSLLTSGLSRLNVKNGTAAARAVAKFGFLTEVDSSSAVRE